MLIYPTIFLKMKRECTFVQWKQWQCDSSHDYWWLGLDSSHVEKNGDSSHVFHRITPVESQSMTRDYSQSHFKKISWVPDGQTPFICTQRT